MPSMTAPATDDRIEEEMLAWRVTGMTAGTQGGDPLTAGPYSGLIVPIENFGDGMDQIRFPPKRYLPQFC